MAVILPVHTTPTTLSLHFTGLVGYIRPCIVLIGSDFYAEYPDYVSPTMDLFVEDQVPFGVSSPLSCPKDSEHLERAFDLSRYHHLSKKLGVPSVVNQHAPVIRLLRILGNTSSGSLADVLSPAKLLSDFDASSTQGGPRQTHSGSSGALGGTYPVRRYYILEINPYRL
jgi:hypothetical protein